MSEAMSSSERVRAALQHVEFLNMEMAREAYAARFMADHQVLATDNSLMGVIATQHGLPAQISVGISGGIGEGSNRKGQIAYNTPAATYSLSSAELQNARLGFYKWPATSKEIQGPPYRNTEWLREPFKQYSEVEQGTLVHGLPLIGTLRLAASFARAKVNRGPHLREQVAPARIMTIFNGSLTLMGEVKRPEGK